MFTHKEVETKESISLTELLFLNEKLIVHNSQAINDIETSLFGRVKKGGRRETEFRDNFLELAVQVEPNKN